MSGSDKIKSRKRQSAREKADLLGLPNPHPHPKKRKKPNLTPQQQLLVEGKLKGMAATDIAKMAGYSNPQSVTNAVKYGTAVGEALKKAQKAVAKKLEYTSETAMKEAERGMDFAIETGNANAYVKAVELRAKIQGLLVEKLDVRAAVGFSVNIMGINRKKDNGE